MDRLKEEQRFSLMMHFSADPKSVNAPLVF